jgi:hypothetical protein
MIIIWLARTSPIFQGANADYGVKSSGDILWEVRLHGWKTILAKTFQYSFSASLDAPMTATLSTSKISRIDRISSSSRKVSFD